MTNDFVCCVLPKTFVLQEPDNGYVTGTMTIDNGNRIADVHVRSGLYSSDTIFDYSSVSKPKNLPWLEFLNSEVILEHSYQKLSWNMISLKTPLGPPLYFTHAMWGLIMKPVVAAWDGEKDGSDLHEVNGEWASITLV